jgi:hypothetical protein
MSPRTTLQPQLPLPERDHRLSPYTGWTRAHWEAVADHWLATTRQYASPGGARFALPGRASYSGPDSDALEGFARTFLLAAARIAGAPQSDPAALRLAEQYGRGLAAGTDPDGPEYWLPGEDCIPLQRRRTQPTVEAANIALALHLSRGRLWDRLDPAVQQRIADWLDHHARLEVWPNNWLLFSAVIAAFLESTGRDAPDRTDAVRRVESWHLGEGWYTDGWQRNIDHYNAWVIHPFLWAWYDLVGADRDPAAAALWRGRLDSFLHSYPRLFGSDGAPVHQGRSLTYRTATLAPVWLGAMLDLGPLAPGAARRLASGTLAHFTEQGVGTAGPLPLGWFGEHLPMVQSYSGPGSPYFAGLGFLGLALPADHPVWIAPEQAQPSETVDAAFSLPGPGWLVHSSAGDGIVRLVNHGSDHAYETPPGSDPDDPHYAKFGYSTRTAPGTGPGAAGEEDNRFALLDDHGRPSRRGPILAHRAAGPIAGSVHRPQRDGTPLPGARCVTVSLVDGPYELRCHLLTAPGAYAVREGGHAVAADAPPGAGTTAEGLAWVRREDGFTAALLPVHGYPHGAAGVVRQRNANALGSHAAVPVLVGSHDAGAGSDLHVAVHLLAPTADPFDPDALARELHSAAAVTVSGTTVTVGWRAGRTDSVDLATFCPARSQDQ